MPRFLSDEWVAALGQAAATLEVDPSITLAVRQSVGDVAWTVRVSGGRVAVDRGPEADVTVTTDAETAAALVRGELATQDAFAAGRLRIGGDLVRLLGVAGGLPAVHGVYAEVRATTTYAP